MLGRPGKMSGLILRILQCVFAATSLGVMILAPKFSSCTTFSCLIFVMGVEVFWSLILSCIHVWSSRLRIPYTPVHLILICIGDWAIGFICLGVACASAAVVDFLYRYDLCYRQYMPCNMYTVSIIMAFVACFFLAISAIVMFRLVASASY